MILLVGFLTLVGLTIGQAQDRHPMKEKGNLEAITLDHSDSDSIELVYEDTPSNPLPIKTMNKGHSPESSEVHLASNEESTEAKFVAESSNSAFAIGEKSDFEGFRVANINPDGTVILMEDTVEPILYVRFQKVITGHIETRLYNEHGTLMMAKKTRNTMLGAEFQLNHSKWSEGTHTLIVRLDNGAKWTKKIVKNSALANSL